MVFFEKEYVKTKIFSIKKFNFIYLDFIKDYH